MILTQWSTDRNPPGVVFLPKKKEVSFFWAMIIFLEMEFFLNMSVSVKKNFK